METLIVMCFIWFPTTLERCVIEEINEPVAQWCADKRAAVAKGPERLVLCRKYNHAWDRILLGS